MTKVVFPGVVAPLVSIVMVTYGGFEWTIDALQAVAEHTDPCYEVIVVDNASPDGTGPQLLDAVEGASIVLNEVNVGFGAGANQGALLAVGRHLFFLNSDAFVRAGWLPPLLAVLDADPAVAAAASCLIEPDGTLQEAGGLVGANGYAGQLGMGDNAALPQYRFRRRVDFASAAALLVRRREFLAVGGFHPSFLMGYFEDADLCLDLARGGASTVYEPASVVAHLRGASTEPGEALRRAAASHAVFVRRWSEDLVRRPPIAELDAYPHRLIAARDFVATDRMLVVSEAADADLTTLVDQFARLWPTVRITLLAAAHTMDARLEALVGAGVEVAVGADDWDGWLAARRFHYSFVTVDGAWTVLRFGGALARTQPQAARIQLARFATGPVDVEMQAVRAADLVLCLSERAHTLVRTWAGGGAAAVLPPSPSPAVLIHAMAGLGMTPPLVRA